MHSEGEARLRRYGCYGCYGFFGLNPPRSVKEGNESEGFGRFDHWFPAMRVIDPGARTRAFRFPAPTSIESRVPAPAATRAAWSTIFSVLAGVVPAKWPARLLGWLPWPTRAAAQQIPTQRLRPARVTIVGIAANSTNISSDARPEAVAKLPRYSRGGNPRTHTAPANSAGTIIPRATRPIEIVEPNFGFTWNRRITHRADMAIAISMMTASNNTPVRRPKRGTAQSSLIGPKTHPTPNMNRK